MLLGELLERETRDVFHYQERPLAVEIDIDNVDQIGMFALCQQLGFTPQPGAPRPDRSWTSASRA